MLQGAGPLAPSGIVVKMCPASARSLATLCACRLSLDAKACWQDVRRSCSTLEGVCVQQGLLERHELFCAHVASAHLEGACVQQRLLER